MISKSQIEAYQKKFGFHSTSTNLDRVKRVILGARGAACVEATKELGSHPGDFGHWAAAAIADDEPFAFEEPIADPATPEYSAPSFSRRASADEPNLPSAATPAEEASDIFSAQPASPIPDMGAPVQGVPKKLLTDAAEDCIAAYLAANAWAEDSIEQVRAAIRLFDFACGSNIFIEDLEQQHVGAFHQLCGNLPNRWGKTRAELEGGLAASLQYAAQLKARGESERI